MENSFDVDPRNQRVIRDRRPTRPPFQKEINMSDLGQATPKKAARAYNLNFKVLNVAETVTSKGVAKIKGKVGITLRGRKTTRTLIAMGAAADAVRAVLVEGQDARVRCLIEHVQNDNGEVGGEFLTAVSLPLEKAA